MPSDRLLAQNLQPFPKTISTITQLEKGVYIVHGLNTVEADALLKITSETRLIFDENAVIYVNKRWDIHGR